MLETMFFTVEGSLPFPIDMLRYDSAVPQDEDDSENILRSNGGCRPYTGKNPKYRIKLVRFSYGVYPTIKRWESFGWNVISVNGVDEPVWKDIVVNFDDPEDQ